MFHAHAMTVRMHCMHCMHGSARHIGPMKLDYWFLVGHLSNFGEVFFHYSLFLIKEKCNPITGAGKHTKTDYSLNNNEWNFTKFLFIFIVCLSGKGYRYMIYHTIFLFKLYVLPLIQNRTWPTLEFTPTAGAYQPCERARSWYI
jgi:hypothetical protein